MFISAFLLTCLIACRTCVKMADKAKGKDNDEEKHVCLYCPSYLSSGSSCCCICGGFYHRVTCSSRCSSTTPGVYSCCSRRRYNSQRPNEILLPVLPLLIYYDSIINKEMTIAVLPPTSSISDVPASDSLGAIPNISTSSRRRNISVHDSEGISVYS